MKRSTERRIDRIGVACVILLAGWVAGIYTAFGAGNRVIDLNLRSHEYQRKLLIQELKQACYWWYPKQRIAGAPVLCHAPEWMVE
mgnify:CR=1 FL=1